MQNLMGILGFIYTKCKKRYISYSVKSMKLTVFCFFHEGILELKRNGEKITTKNIAEFNGDLGFWRFFLVNISS